MSETLITDLTHFLTEDGVIAPKSGPAKHLADFLAEIVVAATSPADALKGKVVKCRRRPRRRLCGGEVDAVLYQMKMLFLGLAVPAARMESSVTGEVPSGTARPERERIDGT